jgi:hypothetical protein
VFTGADSWMEGSAWFGGGLLRIRGVELAKRGRWKYCLEEPELSFYYFCGIEVMRVTTIICLVSSFIFLILLVIYFYFKFNYNFLRYLLKILCLYNYTN